MNQSPVNPYIILVVILLPVAIICGLTYGGYRLFRFIHRSKKKAVIEPANDECSDL